MYEITCFDWIPRDPYPNLSFFLFFSLSLESYKPSYTRGPGGAYPHPVSPKKGTTRARSGGKTVEASVDGARVVSS